jgi:hypothetical protein
MKLWLIERIGKVDWDQHIGFVVRASNESEARALADSKSCSDEKGDFLNQEKSFCIEIPQDGEAGLILDSYKAG